MTSVIPALRVSSRATVDEWIEAFGLEPVFLKDEGEIVGHAELRLGDAWVMASTPRGNAFDVEPGKTTMYFVLDDPDAVDALHARAVAAGATSLLEPYDADYGGRHCSLRDLDGNHWSFGTYAPGTSS